MNAPYCCQEKEQPVLYVQLMKCLYGCHWAAIQFWKKLTQQLVQLGFVINPYDQCVANKVVNGSQFTITWHVDDLKLSCVDPSALDAFLDDVNQVFSKESLVVVQKGPRHDYLGISLDYSSPGKVIVDMKQYIDKVLAEAPLDIRGVAQTPAGELLFKLNPECKCLDAPSTMLFHHLVACLLFSSKRARPDILMAVAFLTIWVQAPNWDDYKKLAKVLNYLCTTRDLVLTQEASNTGGCGMVDRWCLW